MRKVVLFMLVSADGYFEGPNHDITWHKVDDEFNEFAIAQTKKVGTLLFGRRTYQLMEAYWPTEQAVRYDPIVAGLMNNTPKVVFSKKLKKVEETEYWKNVRLIKDNAAAEVKKLKKQRGGDIAIYGSNNLCVSLMKGGLVDEFNLMINPIAIGSGTSIFKGLEGKLNLKLVKIKTFKNGNVLLCYQTVKK